MIVWEISQGGSLPSQTAQRVLNWPTPQCFFFNIRSRSHQIESIKQKISPRCSPPLLLLHFTVSRDTQLHQKPASRTAGTVKQHMHKTFMKPMPYPHRYLSILSYSMFVSSTSRKFFSWSQRGEGDSRLSLFYCFKALWSKHVQ
jgi:hypothetical protein